MRTLIVLLLLFVTGCAGTKSVWVKEGATRQEWDRDRYDCWQRHQPGFWFGTGWGALAAKSEAEDRAKELRRSCLRARGWERREVPASDVDKVGFREKD